MTNPQDQQPPQAPPPNANMAMANNEECHGCSFDPYTWEFVYFFGPLERKEAERLLANTETGTFLLRESTTKPGYSISVKEAGDQVNNYLIERMPDVDGKAIKYKISDLTFSDIPSLLIYFKLSKLESTPLRRPLEKSPVEKVIGRFKFEGERVSDLPFERGELLDVLGKPEAKWWMARNCLGNIGLIPANYVKVYEEGDEISLQNASTKSSGSSSVGKRISTNSNAGAAGNETGGNQQQQQPTVMLSPPELKPNSWVRVLFDRWPSIYDVVALNIRKGQFLRLKEILPTGMCRGTNGEGKSGLFPVTYIEPVPANEPAPWTLGPEA